MMKENEFLDKIDGASIEQSESLYIEFIMSDACTNESAYALRKARNAILMKKIDRNMANTQYPATWNKIQVMTKDIELGRYDLSVCEMQCLRDIYMNLDMFSMIHIAFKIGFVRGIKKSKNDAKKNRVKKTTKTYTA